MAAMPEFSNQTILITGCTGFVSSWVVQLLCDRGTQVVGLVRRPPAAGSLFAQLGLSERATLLNGDVADAAVIKEAIARNSVDTVLHMAAQTDVLAARQQPRATLEANTRGTWNVLEAVRLSERRPAVVLMSTDAVYGETGDHLSTEESPLRCTAPYEVSKACAEMVGRMYFEAYGVAVCIGRLSNVYGPGDVNFNRIVPGTIRAALAGERLKMRSDGRAVRDYIYVEDAAGAIVALADCARQEGVNGQVFNISSERPVSALQMVELILSVLERPDLTPEIGRSSSDEVSMKKSSSYKLRNVLGWHPGYSLEQGLRKTADWYRNGCDAARAWRTRDEAV